MTQAHDLWHLLDSKKLRTFVMLAKTGSFTLAGREVGISQSGVSHCIHSLESDMGCRLFDRLGKKVHTTPAGEQLLHHAQRILQEMGIARDSIQKLSKWGQGRLRLAASPAACQYILPDLFASFKRSFPQMLISIESCNSSRALEVLEDRGADMALALRPEGPSGCHFEPLFQDELCFIMAPEHPWLKKPQVPRESIPDEPFISYSKSSLTFRMIESYFRREEIALNVAMS